MRDGNAYTVSKLSDGNCWMTQNLRLGDENELILNDANSDLRKSHENPAVTELYNTYLGEPGGEKAHHLLHTVYHAR